MLADLPEYGAALHAKPETGAPTVTFTQLWNAPERFRGRQVRVEGRLARRFQQPAQGNLPALSEFWLADGAGNPICVVFPSGDMDKARPPGEMMRFQGTFLKRLRYRGADGERLAPLIVGPEAPVATGQSPSRAGTMELDWIVGGSAALLVAAVLLVRHLGGPKPVRRRPEPAPQFLSGSENDGPTLP